MFLERDGMGFPIDELEQVLGYRFKSRENIYTAMQHPGAKKNTKSFGHKFEKLEFLGDRVLGLSLADVLYKEFEHDTEGDLAIRMATLAGTDFLIGLAKRTGIIKHFKIPKDFFVSINKTSSSIADMMEAVFAAVYLDSNFQTVKMVIANLWREDIKKVVYKRKDSKSLLQEMLQAKGRALPVYRLIKMIGADHDPIFEVEVAAGEHSAIGCGNSKKAAEHEAATKLIEKLKGITF